MTSSPENGPLDLWQCAQMLPSEVHNPPSCWHLGIVSHSQSQMGWQHMMMSLQICYNALHQKKKCCRPSLSISTSVNVVVDVLPQPAPSPCFPIFSTLHITCHSLKENQIFAQKPLLTNTCSLLIMCTVHINISLLKRCLKIQNSACKIPPSKAQSTMNYSSLSNFEICMPVLKLARSVHPHKYGKFFAFLPAFGPRD